MKRSLTGYAKAEIGKVHRLSIQYNGRKGKHDRALLKLVKKHAKEIEDLHKKRDGHLATEVGDLLILCHELILESGKDPDEIMELCYGRYKNKLRELISGKRGGHAA